MSDEANYLYEEQPSFLDSQEFKSYRDLVLTAVQWFGVTGATIGDIKRRLKSRFRYDWTADALSGMDEIGAMPTRYRMPELAPVKIFTADEKRNYWVSGVQTV